MEDVKKFLLLNKTPQKKLWMLPLENLYDLSMAVKAGSHYATNLLQPATDSCIVNN